MKIQLNKKPIKYGIPLPYDNPREWAIMETQEAQMEIWAKANPAFRKVLRYCKKWFNKDAEQNIRSRYDLGVVVKEVYDDMTRNSGKYGIASFDNLEKCFPWEKQTLRCVRHLAAAFTPEEIDQICEMRMAQGEPVYFSHLRSLLFVDDREARWALLRMAVEEGLNTGEFETAVRDWQRENAKYYSESGSGKRQKAIDTRGRPLAIPRNFDAALRQQQISAKDFIDRCERVWERKEHCLLDKVNGVAPNCLNEERLEKLKEHVERLERLAKKAQERAAEAKKAYKLFKHRLKETTVVRTAADDDSDVEPGYAESSIPTADSIAA